MNNLIKKNVRKFIGGKEKWETSNYQQNCDEIIQRFVYDNRMEELRNKMSDPMGKGLAITNGASLKYRGKHKQLLK